MQGISKLAGAIAAATILSFIVSAHAKPEYDADASERYRHGAGSGSVAALSARAGNAFARNPYNGRNRVEEDKFPEVPCNATRIAGATGGKCLQGYRLIPALTQMITNPKGGDNCDLALDVTIYTAGNLSIEADTLISDPYKLTAIGFHGTYCYVSGYPGYDLEDFRDMNQVTRRGTNWHNLAGDGEDKSVAFSDGQHQCVAVKRAGPPWQGGYIYMMHASICRTDLAGLQAQDIAYALGSLQIWQYDPVGNLRHAGQ